MKEANVIALELLTLAIIAVLVGRGPAGKCNICPDLADQRRHVTAAPGLGRNGRSWEMKLLCAAIIATNIAPVCAFAADDACKAQLASRLCGDTIEERYADIHTQNEKCIVEAVCNIGDVHNLDALPLCEIENITSASPTLSRDRAGAFRSCMMGVE
jgi:hypothetical protein